jgi:hypothetical protein
MPVLRIRFAILIYLLLGITTTTAPVAAQNEIPAVGTKALIRVGPENPDADEFAINRYRQTQVALLTSDMVVRAAFETPPVKALLKDETDPVGYIQKRLRTRFEGDILGVWMSAGTPADQATILNAVVDRFVEIANQQLARVQETQEKQYAASVVRTEAEIEQARRELESSRASGVEFERESRPLILKRYHDCEQQDLALRLKAVECEVRQKANEMDGAAALQAKVIAEQRAILRQERETLRAILEIDPPPALDRDAIRARILQAQTQLSYTKDQLQKSRSEAANADRIEIVQRAGGP